MSTPPPRNYKGELITFCQHKSIRLPQFKTQRESEISQRWICKCTVTIPQDIISQIDPAYECKSEPLSLSMDTLESRKKGSEAEAAKRMLEKLKSLFENYDGFSMQHLKHLDSLRQMESISDIVKTVESQFTDDAMVCNNQWLPIICNSDNLNQWLSVNEIISYPLCGLRFDFGPMSGRTPLQCSELTALFVQIIESHSQLLEISNDRLQMRRQPLFENLPAFDTNKANRLRMKGNIQFRNSSYRNAIDWYSQSIHWNRYDHKCFQNRSLSYLKLNRINDAMTDANEALKLEPNSAKAFSIRAMIFESMGDFIQSKRAIEHALDREGQNGNFLAFLDRLTSLPKTKQSPQRSTRVAAMFMNEWFLSTSV